VGDLPTVAGDKVAGLRGRHGEWLEAWEHVDEAWEAEI
jgi:hypothetical protein